MVQNEAGVKIRASEKDQLIAELRQQLYDLRNQDRDYRGVNDEIFAMENRYRMLSDDKARSEHENRLRLDRAVDEIQEARRQLEELKYTLSEKSK
jgi:chromosome segregation ATPase